MEEVFQQYILMGQLNEAIKLYGRGMRENCTSPNYILSVKKFLLKKNLILH